MEYYVRIAVDMTVEAENEEEAAQEAMYQATEYLEKVDSVEVRCVVESEM